MSVKALALSVLEKQRSVPTSIPQGTPARQQDSPSGNRFGQPHADLFPLLGRKVRTPKGPGTLLQVFADRTIVLLDADLEKCSWFRPEEIGEI
jgi:hypothetical protein